MLIIHIILRGEYMLNFKRESLPLKTTTGRLLTLNREFLEDLVHELE